MWYCCHLAAKCFAFFPRPSFTHLCIHPLLWLQRIHKTPLSLEALTNKCSRRTQRPPWESTSPNSLAHSKGMIFCSNDYESFLSAQYMVWGILFLTLSTESFAPTAIRLIAKSCTRVFERTWIRCCLQSRNCFENAVETFFMILLLYHLVQLVFMVCRMLLSNAIEYWLHIDLTKYSPRMFVKYDCFMTSSLGEICDAMSCTPAPYTPQSCSDLPSHKSWIWRTGTWANKRPWRTVNSSWDSKPVTFGDQVFSCSRASRKKNRGCQSMQSNEPFCCQSLKVSCLGHPNGSTWRPCKKHCPMATGYFLWLQAGTHSSTGLQGSHPTCDQSFVVAKVKGGKSCKFGSWLARSFLIANYEQRSLHGGLQPWRRETVMTLEILPFSSTEDPPTQTDSVKRSTLRQALCSSLCGSFSFVCHTAVSKACTFLHKEFHCFSFPCHTQYYFGILSQPLQQPWPLHSQLCQPASWTRPWYTASACNFMAMWL